MSSDEPSSRYSSGRLKRGGICAPSRCPGFWERQSDGSTYEDPEQQGSLAVGCGRSTRFLAVCCPLVASSCSQRSPARHRQRSSKQDDAQLGDARASIQKDVDGPPTGWAALLFLKLNVTFLHFFREEKKLLILKCQLTYLPCLNTLKQPCEIIALTSLHG